MCSIMSRYCSSRESMRMVMRESPKKGIRGLTSTGGSGFPAGTNPNVRWGDRTVRG